MKAIIITGTVITNKNQAISYVERINKEFATDKSYEMAFVIDELTSRLVESGFLTWGEVEAIAA